jgi:hypothetical protein
MYLCMYAIKRVLKAYVTARLHAGSDQDQGCQVRHNTRQTEERSENMRKIDAFGTISQSLDSSVY